ncbi:MAG: methyltransferase domain-containing protein [Pseudomonadota bacterium]
MTKKYLDKAYGHKRGDEATRLYDEWAQSYDEETEENGYATPRRCAEALSAAVGPDFVGAVLDLGCGTGLSGAALRAAGFKIIDGWDPSAAMLQRAEPRRVYRVLRHIDPDARLTARTGVYSAAVAVGVMSPGLAPPEAIDQVLDLLPSGAHFCFSINDHAVKDGAHLRRIDTLSAEGAAEVVFKEYGPHLPGRDMRSWVYVLRKL